MARLSELTALAVRYGLRMITIKDLIQYRIQKDKLVRRAATTLLPTAYGAFHAITYETTVDDRVVLALTMGEIRGDDPDPGADALGVPLRATSSGPSAATAGISSPRRSPSSRARGAASSSTSARRGAASGS